MTRPSVTVAICTIPGRETLLERAVVSVAAQTVMPDALTIHADVERLGACDARNAALTAVRTEYVAWLDDDDELLPSHLERCLVAAEITGADVVYPWMLVDPPHMDNLRTVNDEGRLVSPLGVEFGDRQRRQLEVGHNFLHLTALIRVNTIRRVGGFVALGPRGSEEDAGLYQLLAGSGASFYHVAERTWVWHRGDQSTSGRGFPRRTPPEVGPGPLDFHL